MNTQSRSETAIENEISRLEEKLKKMGAIIGHQQDLPPETHLAFLRSVYAFERKQPLSSAKITDETIPHTSRLTQISGCN